jgi:hypothetical protein
VDQHLYNTDSGNERVVGSINFLESRHKKRVELFSGFIALLVVFIYTHVLTQSGYSPYLLLIIVALLIPGIPVHEEFHLIFQWVFSGRKPYMGFKFPFPYSALAPGARITRNQAIVSALAPFFFITIILMSISLLFGQPMRIITQAWAFIEMATCFGDFYLVLWLLKYPSQTKLGNISLINTLFMTNE